MVDRDEWQRLYGAVVEVQVLLNDVLPPVPEPVGALEPGVAVDAVDIDRADALVEELHRRWTAFQEFVRSQ